MQPDKLTSALQKALEDQLQADVTAGRLTQAQADAQREETAAKLGFSAYGITQGDDPVAQAMKSLIDHAAAQEHQITMLWQAVETLSAPRPSDAPPSGGCVPADAQTSDSFDAAALNRLVK